MIDITKLYQTADWKTEKHVPVIEVPADIKAGEPITLSVSVGKEIPHPNTTEHHISWIDVYFLPDGETFPYHLGRCEFLAHGASTQGADTSGVYSDPKVSFDFKTEKSGEIIATSHCNIHGLWVNSETVKL